MTTQQPARDQAKEEQLRKLLASEHKIDLVHVTPGKGTRFAIAVYYSSVWPNGWAKPGRWYFAPFNSDLQAVADDIKLRIRADNRADADRRIKRAAEAGPQ